MADTMLYEVCCACGGTGELAEVAREGVRYQACPCPVCVPLRVVPTGVTAGQLAGMVAREAARRAKGE